MLFTEIYKDLASIDCSWFTEKKKDLTYLSWSHAWNAVASRYDSSYEVVRFDWKPYFFDESLGYYVETEVTIGGNIRKMQLFVMDGANNAMTNKEYTYEVDEWVYGKKTGKKIEKTVGKATMFEINTAIMRCLTKNLAIFGLGINIYAWEDLPLIDDEGNTVEKKIAQKVTPKVATINTPTWWTALKYFNFPDLKKCIAGGIDTEILLSNHILDNWYTLSGDMKQCLRNYCNSWELIEPIRK